MENVNIQFVRELTEQLKATDPLSAKKIKLIIHAGTPKTGTTSIQTYLGKKQGKLRRKGILYPHNIEKITNPSAPKHQWFEKNLVATHMVHFQENFKNAVSQVDSDTHTIILSSEGIYNYWWDISDESKAMLVALNTLFDIEVWVWFREPLEFIESYYKQCIRNPVINGNPCYGQALSFSQMLDIDWFSRHLNYEGFVNDCQALFGEKSVSIFKYETDVVQAVIRKLGMATPHDNPTPRQNNSLNAATISILRTINKLEVKAKDKERLIPHLKQVNSILQNYADDTLIDEESRKRVMEIHQPVTD